MKVKVAKRVYEMSKSKYEGLLKIASEQVPFGIYAIEKQGYAELQNIKVSSISKLKELTRTYKSQGYKVYSNRG